MKKLFLVMSVVFLSTVLFAQKGAVSFADYELDAEKPNLDKAKEKIDAATKNEKTKDWPKTYIVKSKVYRAYYSKKKQDKAIIYAAYDAILKADELDKKGDAKGKKKGKYEKDIVTEMVLLRQDLMNEGVKANNELKDFKRTSEAFKKVLALSENPTYLQGQEASIDTVVLYNVLVSAYSAKDYETVIEYAPKVIATGYQEDKPHLILYDAYKNLNDTVNMIETLKAAMLEYPDNKVFLDQLVFHYVEMQNADEGIRYIQKSLDKDPNNSKLIFIMGTFYDEVGKKDEAIAAYKRINELPDADEGSIQNANYNLGVVYYNKAVEESQKAQDIKDYKKFKAAEKEALKSFELCLPYFETCLKINPENKDALNALKPVYYRLTKLSKTYNDKYKAVNDKLKTLE